MIADPRAPLVDAPPRFAALAELARLLAETPWALSVAHRVGWQAAGLTDEDILQAVILASYFGHLNRIADAVAVPLDYDVRLVPPHADPTTAPLAPAPAVVIGVPVLALASRTATHDALAAWAAHVFAAPHAPAIRARVARLLGMPAEDVALDPEIGAFVDQLTLAPWQLGDASYTALRARGLDDAALFSLAMIASTAGMLSRIEVALTALGTTPSR